MFFKPFLPFQVFLATKYFKHAGTPSSFPNSPTNMRSSFSCQSEVQHAVRDRRLHGNNPEASKRQKHCNKRETVWMWKGNRCIAMANLCNLQKHHWVLLVTLQCSDLNVVSRGRSTNSYPQSFSSNGGTGRWAWCS